MNRTMVLIVEDEPLIRMNAVMIAEGAGFDVVEAANADDAIAILDSQNDIAAVFTDINMPGSMDGMKLAHAILDRWPPIHVIITSGRITPPSGDIPAGGCFLPKPYDAERLVRALRATAA